jgi:hypothetical protein
MVRTLGYKYQKLVHEFLCHQLPAESVETRWSNFIYQLNDVYSGGSETEMSPRSWIQII